MAVLPHDDGVSSIETFNAGRDPRLLPRKYQAMAGSSFAFFRATAHLFYGHAAQYGLPAAPKGWICGDLHVENFGVYRADNRLNYFDVNDFDEACFGPLSADLVRLGTSILLACAEMGLPSREAEAFAAQSFAAYLRVLAGGKAIWSEAEIATGAIKALFEQISDRKRADFLDARTTVRHGFRKFNCDDKHYMPCGPQDETPDSVTKFLGQVPAPEAGYFDLRDMAFRIAGLGSLGLARYALLVKGRGDPDKNAMFDLKSAAPSVAAGLMPQHQPPWPDEASRVVTLQKRLQAMPARALAATRTATRDYIMRELQPQEDRLDLAHLAKHRSSAFSSLSEAFNHMGEMAAAMHLRGAARQGADGPDILIAYGESADAKPLLAAAQAYKARNDEDFRRFRSALPLPKAR